VAAAVADDDNRSRLTVEEHDGHAHVDWVAEFEPQRPQDEGGLA
jgi:hypothetical protein